MMTENGLISAWFVPESSYFPQEIPEAAKVQPKGIESESEVAQSCPTLCDPVDGSLPGSSVHGILQARILEWVAISFSKRDLKQLWNLSWRGSGQYSFRLRQPLFK